MKGLMNNGLTTSEEEYYFNKGYQLGRAVAIEDFVKFANTMPTVEEDGEIRPMWLEEMAEQLKSQDSME